jgi:hypothetical protein
MTPKEKAHELAKKMLDSIDDSVFIKSDDFHKWRSTVIKCAIIAVDEILDELQHNLYYDTNAGWWQDVKIELEKL